jgi:AcrR family transcriptional regulator
MGYKKSKISIASIVDAAMRVLARQGYARTSLMDIASEVGMSKGAVHYHFPTKEALLTAVYLARLRRLTEQARALSTDGDPEQAFFAFVTQVVGQATGKRAIVEALTEAGVHIEIARSQVGRDLREAIHTLLTRAQSAGAVRTDLEVEDLFAVMVGASHAATFASQDKQVQDRALAVILDGLRPRAGQPR